LSARNRAPCHHADEVGAIVGACVHVRHHVRGGELDVVECAGREVPRERLLRICPAEDAGLTGTRHGDTHATRRPRHGDTDESEARRLRRSVLVEVVFAAAILAITAVLVNTAPARTESTEPVSLALRSGGAFADITIAPAVAGPNDIHVTVLSTSGQNVTDLQLQLTRPGSDFAAFDVPLRPLGPNHEYAPQYNIPFPGEWRVALRVQLGTTDEAVLTGGFSVR